MAPNRVQKIRYSKQVPYDTNKMETRCDAPIQRTTPIHDPIFSCLEHIFPDDDLEIQSAEIQSKEPPNKN